MLETILGTHSAAEVGRASALAIVLGLLAMYAIVGTVSSLIEKRKRKKDLEHATGT